MKHEAFTCDRKGHAQVPAVHHVTLDGPERSMIDLCDQCMAEGLAMLLSNLSAAAQVEWRAAVLGEV